MPRIFTDEFDFTWLRVFITLHIGFQKYSFKTFSFTMMIKAFALFFLLFVSFTIVEGGKNKGQLRNRGKDCHRRNNGRLCCWFPVRGEELCKVGGRWVKNNRGKREVMIKREKRDTLK